MTSVDRGSSRSCSISSGVIWVPAGMTVPSDRVTSRARTRPSRRVSR